MFRFKSFRSIAGRSTGIKVENSDGNNKSNIQHDRIKQLNQTKVNRGFPTRMHYNQKEEIQWID